ncbi:hypothetical protein BD310DRAFT_932508 [Dichomitus squalens]|uniref:Uncharacterized protein n=1 Tax=Dichomitus squalens TaxID=114155 RepID=A0A4Q9PNS0_9APHY|nr:hypothetical protein BD310DRAFT_932508 [Dichomitus squalens]
MLTPEWVSLVPRRIHSATVCWLRLAGNQPTQDPMAGVMGKGTCDGDAQNGEMLVLPQKSL